MPRMFLCGKGAVPVTAWLGVGVGLLLSFGGTARATAVPITFAQFSEAQNVSNPNLFAYVDNGAASDSELISSDNGTSASPTVASIPVVFNYLGISSLLPADLQGDQDATLTLTSSTIYDTFPAGMELEAQDFDGTGQTDDVLTITRDTPAAEGNGSRTNLLTMYFYPGFLLGLDETRTPQLFGGEDVGSEIFYSSDFLNFGADSETESDFSLTFTSWTTNSDGGGLEGSSSDDYFASATAAGTGTFDTVEVTVPEPGCVGLMLVGGMMVAARRKRRASN